MLARFQCASLAQPHPNRQQCEHQAGVAFDTQACCFKINSSICHPFSCVPEGISCVPVETHPGLGRSLFSVFSLVKAHYAPYRIIVCGGKRCCPAILLPRCDSPTIKQIEDWLRRMRGISTKLIKQPTIKHR